STGTNVYIAGSIGQVGSLSQMACYWKNGVVHLLPCDGPGTNTVEVANDIVIKGNDVYATGMAQSITIGNQYPLYWKNDQVQFLPEKNTDADATGIAINGGDVYIAGGDGSGATIWKNGVAGYLPGGVSAQRLVFVGNDLYVAGASSVNSQ